MVSILNNELIGSPNKTLIKENLFDFIKKRENMNLCGSENSVFRLSHLLKEFFQKRLRQFHRWYQSLLPQNLKKSDH